MTILPYKDLGHSGRIKLLLGSALMTVFMGALLLFVFRIPSPGVFRLEFSFLTGKIQEIYRSWSEPGRICAALNLGLDYLFMIFYALTFSLSSLLIAEDNSRYPLFSLLGGYVCWAPIVAAGLDAVENLFLILILTGYGFILWGPLAALFAAGKFLLIISALLYNMAGGILIIIHRPVR